jgi:hypothetical protein
MMIAANNPVAVCTVSSSSPHCGQDTAFEETSRAAARLAVDQL